MPEQQPYDSALKSLLGDEVAEILPNLLPGAEFIGEQNIEIDRTTLRADLVYNIRYRGALHILNMELQTDADEDMPLRMLKYQSSYCSITKYYLCGSSMHKSLCETMW